MAEWDTEQLWRKQIERRLYELAALAKGAIPVQADRIADVVEITHEISKELKALKEELAAVKERQQKIADYLREHVKKHGENGNESIAHDHS